MRWLSLSLFALSALALPGVAAAQEGPVEPEGPLETPPEPQAQDEPTYQEDTTSEAGDVSVHARRPIAPGRSTSSVTRDELDQRQPRSAPDALRYEPGVYVQQTAHSQGSAFIRGRTGQQTLLMFDGVRLNNSLFRQGPNQYFFTIDSRTIGSIDVLRGSASTRFGSDAIAGVIDARPTEPSFQPDTTFRLRPRAQFRSATQDGELGGRLQLESQLGSKLGVLVGLGYRDVGMLESGGELLDIHGKLPEVPRFEDDGRTQRGTGFREWTDDLRLVYKPSDDLTITTAWYDYRQFDAPRTDQCAPAFAPFDDCLEYEEQFRSLAYSKIKAKLGPWARDLRASLSWQRQHERRKLDRPSSNVVNGGRDDVDSFGFRVQSATDWWTLSSSTEYRLRYGGDLAHDRVESTAWLTFTDIEVTRFRSRGQYMDGSSYSWAGGFAELETLVSQQLVLRVGGRASGVHASAPGDEDSGTQPVDQSFSALVGNIGAEWWLNPWLTMTASVDQGFRAPNLDDLTSRQQTGPGFQFENANLGPEHAVTAEIGTRIDSEWVELGAWVYWSHLDDAIARSPRNDLECPPDTRQCQNSWARFQLVNLDGRAIIYGAESSAKLKLPYGTELRGSLSYAWGDGPSSVSTTETGNARREPLSRIPPLNGTLEGLWRFANAYTGFGFRWATRQDRLALSDVSDERIPAGGTPGYAVVDLRAGYRWQPWALVSVVAENVTDSIYRTHGSSVNGAGRGLSFQAEVGW